ncbi:MAG: hypothetical protein WHS44_04915 [Fimbriimonadales bacterium]|nr:MAG: hypothetical protein KatS3mg018_2588 [Fimbriimonadales bacterium]
MRIIACLAILFTGLLAESQTSETPVASSLPTPASTVLFTIPYGSAENQIYIESTPGPGEGEFGLGLAPVGFCVLADDSVALVGGRPASSSHELAVQVFAQDGQLKRFVPHPSVYTFDRTSVLLHHDGSVYYIASNVFVDYLYERPSSAPDPDHNHPDSSDTKDKPLSEKTLAISRLLTVVDAKGKVDATLTEALRDQLRSLLSARDDLWSFGDYAVVDGRGTVYISVLLASRAGEEYAKTPLAKLSPTGAAEWVEEPPGRLVRSYDGSMAYVKFERHENPRDEAWVSAYTFVDTGGKQIARFQAPPRASRRSLITLDPVLIRRDRLAIVSFEGTPPDKPNRAAQIPLPFQAYYRLMVITPEGKIVHEDWVQGPPVAGSCATDGKGNLYYLNFTDEGVEVKKISVP